MNTNIRRSILSVPGHIEKMHKKAVESDADVIMLDMEDSVPLNLKDQAREEIIKSVNTLIWGNKVLSIRVNGLDTPYFYDDVIKVCEKCGDKINSIVIPKVDKAADIHFYDRILTGIEAKAGISRKINIEVSIESAEGLNNIFDITNASDRIISVIFGIADYSTSIGARLVSISGHGENEEELYPGHRWHYVLSRISAAAKGKHLFAIDAAYGNFKDIEGLKSSCQKSIALGFDGKWAIHPGQIETINTLFSPTEEELVRARMIVDAEKDAVSRGLGAVAIDGRMVDRATIRLAKKQLEIAGKLNKEN